MEYIDFSKAFDMLSHNKLLVKPTALRISGNLLRWIKNFLTNRDLFFSFSFPIIF